MIGFGIFLSFLSSLCIFIICLIEVLSGNGLETFRLGSVITARSALNATYLDVLIGDLLILATIIGGLIAQYMRHRDEEEFLDRYRPRYFSQVLKRRRLARQAKKPQTEIIDEPKST